MTDTERLYIDLWCQILRERGMEEHRDVVTRCIGMDHGKMRAYIKATLGEGFDYLSVLGEVGKRSETYCQAQGIPVKPGLYKLLDYLDQEEIPYAVATSSRGEGARSKLRQIGVLSRLHGLVTGDMVEKGKPIRRFSSEPQKSSIFRPKPASCWRIRPMEFWRPTKRDACP